MSPLRLVLICLCLAPLASSAVLSGQVHSPERVINPTCLIASQRNRIDVSCQHHSPEQVALTDNPPRYAMPDDRGEVSLYWRNAQHSEADVIIRCRQGKKNVAKSRRMQDVRGNAVGGFSVRRQ